MERKWIKLLRRNFFCIFKPFVWFYVVVFQHVRFKKNNFKVPKGPVLFISNHLSNWDGIYLNCMFFWRIIRFIAHDELFRTKRFAWFSKNVLGQVCRAKSDESISDVLEMKRLVKHGATLGLYPEGDIDMFGRTLPIAESVAKFARLMGIPVVLTKIQGATIRAPRWARWARHASITYSITDVISVDELKNTSISDLHKRIVSGITVDDYVYQSKLMYKQFPTRRRAEWLELGLFYCPKCKKFETLSTKGDILFCTQCDFRAKFNRYSMLETVDGRVLGEWDDIQKAALYNVIDNASDKTPIFCSENLDYYQVGKEEYFKDPISKCSLRLYKDRVEIDFLDKALPKVIYLDDIKKATLQYKDVLEIDYANFRLRFQTKERKWSAYMYATAIKYLLNKDKEKVLNKCI